MTLIAAYIGNKSETLTQVDRLIRWTLFQKTDNYKEIRQKQENRKRKFSFFAIALFKNGKNKKELPVLNFLSQFLCPASFSTFAAYTFLCVKKYTHKKSLATPPEAKELNPARKTKTRAKKFIQQLSQNFCIFDNKITAIKMKTMIFLIMSLIGLATFNSCEKFTDTTWMYYDETYCADPWGQNTVPDDDKKKNVEKYLENKDIKIFKVEITSDGTPENCYSCGCKTGKRIKCKIKESDVSAMKNENFYQ